MSLKEEFEHYLAHKEDLLARYPGKFIVIKDKEVIGVHEDRLVAIKETMKEHELGSFLVQEVTPEGEVACFHSRVVFHSA